MNKNAIKFVILCMSCLILSPNAASVALVDIGRAFPEQSTGMIALTLTLPFVVIIPFSFVSSAFSNIVKKRTLVLTGLVVISVGGLAPIWTKTFLSLIVARGVLGAGLGIMIPLTSGLIPAFFDGKEADTLFGFQSAATNVGQIIFTLVPGLLVVTGWRNIFWSYALAILVLLVAALKLPEPPRAINEENKRTSLDRGIFVVFVLAILFGLFTFPLFTILASFVTSQHMGNGSTVGMILSAETVIALVTGMLFGKIFVVLKQFTGVLGLASLALGFFLISHANGLPMVFAGAAVSGIGMVLDTVVLVIKASTLAGKAAATMATGLTITCVFLGQFLSPILMPVLVRSLGNTSDRFTFLATAWVFVIGLVLFGILSMFKLNSPAEGHVHG